MKVDVLYVDNHCLVVNKPAGMLSQGDCTGDPSLDVWARDYLKRRFHKPGNVYVGLIHRLDRPTSGVVLLARTSKAAGRLSEQFRSGKIAKMYWAIVESVPVQADGHWEDRLEKDRTLNRVRLVNDVESTGQLARLHYRVVERRGSLCKLELHPETGRSHQLRVQLSGRGMPIVGDIKYGAKIFLEAEDGMGRIALHAREMTFTHPTREEVISIVAPAPADWPESVPGWWERWSGPSKPGGG